MEQLPQLPSTQTPDSISKEELYLCPSCAKKVIVFRQLTSTLPQSEENKVRKYLETFCALCGTCLDRVVQDEIV
jgi:hypothetical protein